ncbi:LOW QUALITY PROTEIN: hypothetical protein Nmel_007521, partial [Mimus melanotis]
MHNNWLRIKKKALKDRDFDNAAEIFVVPIATFTTHLMTPHDVKSLANLLLTPTQYAIFMTQWKKRLENLIVIFAGHANQALTPLTIDHLAGERVHTDPNGQVTLPREALEGIMEAACLAFLKIPDARTLQQSFTNIKQAPQEPYMQFVDTLKQTLERQIDNEGKNSHEDCKRLLKSLPPEPEPTLLQMIKACNCLGTLQHIMAVTNQAMGQCITDAFAALKLVPRNWFVLVAGNLGTLKGTAKKREYENPRSRICALAVGKALISLISAAGKLLLECGASTHADTNPTADTATRSNFQHSTGPAPTHRTVFELRAATSGSAGLDIST